MSDTNYTANPKPNAAMTDLAERVRVNQKKLASVADGSIMPRVTTGNTMAPCVVIGERAAQAIRAAYKL